MSEYIQACDVYFGVNSISVSRSRDFCSMFGKVSTEAVSLFFFLYVILASHIFCIATTFGKAWPIMSNHTISAAEWEQKLRRNQQHEQSPADFEEIESMDSELKITLLFNKVDGKIAYGKVDSKFLTITAYFSEKMRN